MTGSPLNPIATRLGNLGLVPFVLGMVLVWLLLDYNEEAHTYATLALSIYAGTVVSFLGGIHWGLGMRQGVPSPQPFVWGVVPAIVAAIATLMPAYAGLVVHGVMLIVCYLVDRRTYPALGAGSWLTLRFRLSLVASLCCFIAAAGV
ncbi:DUF3429 domain-containing protein [Pelomonas sp. V22]|uniref:DUF3429 domain-containing protein n=1 Tax=Pelomonas sp. V22 TaxID=2822139 RepID=UPI0024A8DCBC|nr:DUF3429 domain-containing protein [Pelomonas sp. V22]MDI4632543.1 DUF3429 domain-containing protein [Pelomonas sp. V22]